MMMNNNTFRSAINGFNRQDVIAYIEKAQREAAEHAQELEAQLEELRKCEDWLRSELDKMTEENDALRAQYAEMSERQERTASDLSIAADKAAALEQEVQAACAEHASLSAQLQDAKDEVTIAHMEKENVAQLELDARKRADDVMKDAENRAESLLAQARAQAQALLTNANQEAETLVSTANEKAETLVSTASAKAEMLVSAAHEKAEEIRAAMEVHVVQTSAEANKLISSVDAITAHVSAELRKMDVAITQLPINFNHLKDGLKDIVDRAEERHVTKN